MGDRVYRPSPAVVVPLAHVETKALKSRIKKAQHLVSFRRIYRDLTK